MQTLLPPYRPRVTKPRFGTPLDWTSPLTRGLCFAWHGQPSTGQFAEDLTGRLGVHGVYHGSPVYQNDDGGAFSFATSSDHIDFSDGSSSPINFTGGTFSVQCDFFLPSTPNSTWVPFNRATFNTAGWLITGTNDLFSGVYRFGLQSNVSGSEDYIYYYSATAGAFQRMLLVMLAGALTLYKNGILWTATGVSGTWQNPTSYAGPAVIGNPDGSVVGAMTGNVSRILIWNRALSAGEAMILGATAPYSYMQPAGVTIRGPLSGDTQEWRGQMSIPRRLEPNIMYQRAV